MFRFIFFCIYLTSVSGEREKLKENIFPEFKVNWSQQLNQRTGLPPVGASRSSRREPSAGLLIYMNHPFHLLTNIKYWFAHKNHPTHLQTHRFTERHGGSHNWVEQHIICAPPSLILAGLVPEILPDSFWMYSPRVGSKQGLGESKQVKSYVQPALMFASPSCSQPNQKHWNSSSV